MVDKTGLKRPVGPILTQSRGAGGLALDWAAAPAAHVSGRRRQGRSHAHLVPTLVGSVSRGPRGSHHSELLPSGDSKQLADGSRSDALWSWGVGLGKQAVGPLCSAGGDQGVTLPVPPQITAVWHGTLVKLLRSLYALALPAASKELRSVEQEVRWRLRRLRYKHLAFLAESSTAYMQERGSQELLAELLLHLERRWAEIEDGRTLVTIMMRTGHLSEPLMNRLEDKVPRLGAGRRGALRAQATGACSPCGLGQLQVSLLAGVS